MPQNKSQKAQILIVDDDPLTRFSLKEMLSLEGYSVTVAENGEIALNLLKNGSTSYVIAQAQADLNASNAQLDQAELMLSRCEIKSPASGILSILNVTKGDMVGSGGYVATVLDQNDVFMYIYIPQSKLRYVSLGKQIRLNTSAYPGESFAGAVVYIASEAEFTPKNVQTREERVKLVYRIKVSLDNPNQELKPGMPVDVYLR